jgi:uncharacterized protein (TIGR02391 family)
MSADFELALQVARTQEIISKIRSVAADAAAELDNPGDKVKPETAALLKAHYDHLVTVAGNLLKPSSLGRHIGFAMQQDMVDIVKNDLPTVEAGIRSKVEAIAKGAETVRYGFEDLLEEKIKTASLKLYSGGHYKAAVLAACDVITEELRSRTQLTLDGVDLVNQAFSPKNPILTWKVGEDKTSHNVRLGYTDLTRGAMAAIRNVYTHGGGIRHTPLQAARHIVFLSTLLYRLRLAKTVKLTT